MAIIKAINSSAGIGGILDYIRDEEKTTPALIGGYNCNPQTATEEMRDTKEMWRKTGGRQYKHFIQSFPADEVITPAEAHRIAGEWVAQNPVFQGYEVCYATHTDRGHVHTHVVVNSVSFETGKKFRYSKWHLQQMKDLSDSILEKYGKSICQKKDTITAFKIGAYRAIEKAVQGKYAVGSSRSAAPYGLASRGTLAYDVPAARPSPGSSASWLYDTAVAVDKAMTAATGKDEFISIMGGMGYTVSWQDSRKYITFINADGKRVRDKVLAKTFKIPISKEELTNEFSKKRTTGRNTRTEAGEVRPDRRHAASAGGRRTHGEVARLRTELGRISKIGESDDERARDVDAGQAGKSDRQQRSADRNAAHETKPIHRETGRSR
ncbi:MAG: relaxase/mobilization nuclease domain-containing protein [Christensenella sp.]|uniref:relaxase/mobilization nuclease domain-containing protein n=1 Tax=Christensenella sp. TaxID=1935934 RepID=UPI002B1F4E2A|nr:relaxase/mobilization nuclease domain-containing protein [Christensenella sp.]MEA5002044.1 relaxase/mobilization nuclease domain-containing protein [Christensenella sp.]